MINFVLVAVAGYVLYRLFAGRFRSRLRRWLITAPLVFTLFLLMQGAELARGSERRLSLEEIEALILDSAFVETGDLVVSVSAAGSIAPRRQSPLFFVASAPVTEIFVTEGSVVDAGQLLARLDSQDALQALRDAQLAQQLQQASYDFLTSAPREVDLAAAQAALNAAIAQVNAAASQTGSNIQAEIARLQYEIAGNRVWQSQLQRDAIPDPSLLPVISLPETGVDPVDSFLSNLSGFISATNQQQIDGLAAQRRQLESIITQTEYAQQIAQANLNSAESRGPDVGALSSASAARSQAERALEALLEGPDEIALNRALIDLHLAELAVAQAEYNLRQLELYAPFAGVIAQNNLTVGQVPPQGAAMLLMDTSALFVDLPVDEVDIVRIRVGQRVELDIDALPGVVLAGHVDRVAYTPLPVGQVSAYLVRVELEPSAEQIRVGMSVTARIVVDERKDVLLVPNRFVRIDRITGDAFVAVQEPDGSFSERMVLLGERNDRLTEIRAGLEPGLRLVLLPTSANGVNLGLFRQTR